MINSRQVHPIKLLFILKGSIIPIIAPQIVFITLFSLFVAISHKFYPAILPQYALAPFTLLGIALSLFLGFRNNACYARWWEGRNLWGQLVISSRNLSRQIMSLIDNKTAYGRDAQRQLICLNIAYNYALKHQLNGSVPWYDIEKFLKPSEIDSLKSAYNLPDAILRLISKQLIFLRQKHLLSDYFIVNLEQHISAMVSVQAGCERIQNTPLPLAYRLLVHRTVYLFCFILPFGLVNSLGLMTPILSSIIAYAFLGLDSLSTELEQPFGTSLNHLPISDITYSIEQNLLENLEELNQT